MKARHETGADELDHLLDGMTGDASRERTELSHSGARLKPPASEQESFRPSRTPVRPSAFGPPRRSVPPSGTFGTSGEQPAREPEALPMFSAPEDEEGESSAAWAMPSDESSPFKRPSSLPAPRPISTPARDVATPAAAPAASASSSARASQAATHAAAQAPQTVGPMHLVSSTALATPAHVSLPVAADEASAAHAAPLKRSRAGVALFLGMLTLGGISVWRYMRVPDDGQRTTRAQDRERQGLDELARVAAAAESPNSAVDAAVVDPQQELDQTITSLLADGNRALEANDAPAAERLFARVIELDEDNPRAAYGLARVRLSQNNLSGAEGWIQQAIRKRPRRAMYHALYAEILDKLGNPEAAQEERAQLDEE